jgi:hypothetical protein
MATHCAFKKNFFKFHKIKQNKNCMFISKNSPLWEIQEIDDIYLMGIYVVITSVGPLVNLVFLQVFQFSNGQ